MMVRKKTNEHSTRKTSTDVIHGLNKDSKSTKKVRGPKQPVCSGFYSIYRNVRF